MAVQTNRRGLLGAALLAPIAAACGASAVTATAASPSQWHALVAEYKAARRKWDLALRVQDRTAAAYWQDRQNAHRAAVAEEAERRALDACGGNNEALEALIAYPVANLSDLAEKMEIVQFDYDCSELPSDIVSAFLADVQRLAGQVQA